MTAQVPERIIFNGQQASMSCCPPLPDHHASLVRLKDEQMDDVDGYILSTCCWREYVGTWELKDEKLYFVDVEGRYQWTGEAPLFADWVSASIRISEGECLKYVHMEFASIHERETYLTIEQGRVVNHRTVEHTLESVQNLDPFGGIPLLDDGFDADHGTGSGSTDFDDFDLLQEFESALNNEQDEDRSEDLDDELPDFI